MNPESRYHRCCPPGLILGIGVILVGMVLLLDQIPGIRESRILEFVKSLWPLILVAMGLARIQQGDDKRPWVLIVAGLLLLIATLGHGRFDALIAPAILLGVGIFIVLRTLRHHRTGTAAPEASGDFIRGTAVLSGIKRRVHSQSFKGGELTAIFGGFDLDLRQVIMDGDSANLDVFLLFGGGEIRVPENWDVTLQAIAGGVGDKVPSLPSSEGKRPRLVLSGLILFGGVEVKR
jgi:predicted membrane protein